MSQSFNATFSKSAVGNEIWLDPTQHEIQVSKGCLVLSSIPALGIITSLWQSGQMKPQEVLKVISIHVPLWKQLLAHNIAQCMELCQERCIDIHSVVAQALLESAKANEK